MLFLLFYCNTKIFMLQYIYKNREGAKSMAKKTFDPSEALKHVKKIYTMVETLVNKNIPNTNTKIKEMAKGDGSIAYWSGKRAYNWYGSAFANIANDYQDCINVCNAVGSFASYAAEIGKENDKETGDSGVPKKLENYASKFHDLATKAKNKRKKVLNNGD